MIQLPVVIAKALLPIAKSNDATRRRMRSIRIEGGVAVATDGYRLVAVKLPKVAEVAPFNVSADALDLALKANGKCETIHVTAAMIGTVMNDLSGDDATAYPRWQFLLDEAAEAEVDDGEHKLPHDQCADISRAFRILSGARATSTPGIDAIHAVFHLHANRAAFAFHASAYQAVACVMPYRCISADALADMRRDVLAAFGIAAVESTTAEEVRRAI